MLVLSAAVAITQIYSFDGFYNVSLQLKKSEIMHI